MSASKLSAAASEFTPSFAAAATTSVTAVPTGEDWGEGEEYGDGYGYYDEQGTWVEYNSEEQQQQEEDDPFNQQTTQLHQHGGDQLALEADDAVALLHSCYPNHPRTLLQQLLEAFDGDVQQAARILSDMDFEQRRSRISAAAAAGRAAGNSTTTSSSTASRGGSSGPVGRREQGFDYSMEQFPALGGGGTVPSSSSSCAAATPTAPGGSSCAGMPSGSNWAAVTSKPAAPVPANSTPRPGANHSRQPAAKQWGDSEGSSAAAVPWVETGQAVSQEYAAARAEASDHARVRNTCFHQATIAFMAGDKALAKELSAKGKAAAEAMWAAHECASSQIYSQRNARLQQQVAAAAGGGGKGSAAAPVIDLHGLHVQEMMQTLPQQLAALTKQRHECVSVIVGVGRHTKGPPAARLGPAVETLLTELGYSFKTPQPGLLRVRLR